MSAAFLRPWRAPSGKEGSGCLPEAPPIVEKLTGGNPPVAGTTYTCKEVVSPGVQEAHTVWGYNGAHSRVAHFEQVSLLRDRGR